MPGLYILVLLLFSSLHEVCILKPVLAKGASSGTLAAGVPVDVRKKSAVEFILLYCNLCLVVRSR